MPNLSIVTTARDVFFGDDQIDSLSFKNGSSTGIIYLRNKQIKSETVASTDYEWSLGPSGSVGFTRVNDGTGITGPWQAISDGAGGVTLEILPIYKPGRARK